MVETSVLHCVHDYQVNQDFLVFNGHSEKKKPFVRACKFFYLVLKSRQWQYPLFSRVVLITDTGRGEESPETFLAVLASL